MFNQLRTMEKLKELLNEYNEGGRWRDENFDKNKLLVISKSYGFIKWLVENDKIDLNNIQDYFYVRSYDKDGIAEKYEYYEELLMLLSIQDEPIEFLISILK